MKHAVFGFALAALIAGCGGGGGDESSAGDSTAKTATVRTTRTEIVKSVAQPNGSFNPQAIYKQTAPGVVTIVSLSGNGSRNALGRGEASLGSGFVVDDQGYIATNAHVVTTGSGKAARAVYVEFSDGNRLTGRIVGTDPFSDVALVKIDPTQLRGPEARLVPLPFGSTRRLSVGDPIAAIGSPFGQQQSLSTGVVSALNRDIASLTRFAIGNAIQTDAAINHGNSGGPLLDSRGRVIGVNSQIRSTGGGGEGVGFAIPVETVQRSVTQLRAKGRVDYAYLGISSLAVYPQLAARLGLRVTTGALVDDVQPNSPADAAGIKGAKEHISFQGSSRVPVGSDVIVKVGRVAVKGSDDLANTIARHEPGKTVTLEIARDGKIRRVNVKLAQRPRRRG